MFFIVPFAVEERSGTISVVEAIDKYEKFAYEFEAVVSNDKELNLVTNVSIHVVDPDDQRNQLTRSSIYLNILKKLFLKTIFVFSQANRSTTNCAARQGERGWCVHRTSIAAKRNAANER